MSCNEEELVRLLLDKPFCEKKKKKKILLISSLIILCKQLKLSFIQTVFLKKIYKIANQIIKHLHLVEKYDLQSGKNR